jgi:hypothetical protein
VDTEDTALDYYFTATHHNAALPSWHHERHPHGHNWILVLQMPRQAAEQMALTGDRGASWARSSVPDRPAMVRALPMDPLSVWIQTVLNHADLNEVLADSGDFLAGAPEDEVLCWIYDRLAPMVKHTLTAMRLSPTPGVWYTARPSLEDRFRHGEIEYHTSSRPPLAATAAS